MKKIKKMKNNRVTIRKKRMRLLKDHQIRQLQKLYAKHKYTIVELCERFGISVPTLYNYLRIQLD